MTPLSGQFILHWMLFVIPEPFTRDTKQLAKIQIVDDKANGDDCFSHKVMSRVDLDDFIQKNSATIRYILEVSPINRN